MVFLVLKRDRTLKSKTEARSNGDLAFVFPGDDILSPILRALYFSHWKQICPSGKRLSGINGEKVDYFAKGSYFYQKPGILVRSLKND